MVIIMLPLLPWKIVRQLDGGGDIPHPPTRFRPNRSYWSISTTSWINIYRSVSARRRQQQRNESPASNRTSTQRKDSEMNFVRIYQFLFSSNASTQRPHMFSTQRLSWKSLGKRGRNSPRQKTKREWEV